MGKWKGVTCAVLVAALALALAPASASACVNEWGMTATRGDGQVSLAWGELPAGHSAKVVRSIYGWPSNPAFGDEPSGAAVGGAAFGAAQRVAGCYVSEPDVVVYRGTERSVVDTTVVNGRTYWYTVFVRDDATGAYLEKKSEVVATPGTVDTVTTPSLGTSYVRQGYRFKVYAKVSRHTVDTKTQVVLQKKVGTSWKYVRSATYVQREGTSSFAAYVTAPSAGSHRVIVRNFGVAEPVAISRPRGFWSHR